jgi:hypothetical protein
LGDCRQCQISGTLLLEKEYILCGILYLISDDYQSAGSSYLIPGKCHSRRQGRGNSCYDWGSFYKSFYADVRLQVACSDPVKIPKERIMEIVQKMYLLKYKVEGVEQIPENTDDGDGPGEEDIDTGGFDKEETMHQMETDRHLSPRANVASERIHDNVYRTVLDVPNSWEDMELDDVRLSFSAVCKSVQGEILLDEWQCNSPPGLCSLPPCLHYNEQDDSVWDFEMPDIDQVDSDALNSSEKSASAAYCSQVLEAFKINDSDEENEFGDRESGQLENLPQEKSFSHLRAIGCCFSENCSS